MSTTIYTAGHSRRTVAELLALLRDAGIARLVDVRAYPHSTRQPWFNGPALRAAVEQHGIAYDWLGRELGGLRPEQPESDQRHRRLRSALRSYADYMKSVEFSDGIARLRELAEPMPTTILCAEKLPANCHRSLISDYLTLQGVAVVHLIEVGQREAHTLHPALRRDRQQLVYDVDRRGQRELRLK